VIVASVGLFGALAAFVASTAPGRTTGHTSTPAAASGEAAGEGTVGESESGLESSGAPQAESEFEEPSVVSGGS
jgi:hypothetical protein